MQGIFHKKPQYVVSCAVLARRVLVAVRQRFAAISGLISGRFAVLGGLAVLGGAFLFLMPEAAFATPDQLKSGTPTGLDKAAADVYAMVTGGLGKTVAATAAGMGAVGLAMGFNARVSAGAVGAGLAVGLGPPVIMTMAGTALF